MTRTLALTILTLALLGLPAVALAQGPPAEKAPDHAADRTPPDHAGDPGPPDDAEAPEAGAGDAAEAAQGDEPPAHAGDQGSPAQAGDQGSPDHAEASEDETPGAEAKAPEPRPTTTGPPEGEEATQVDPNGRPALDEADEEPDAASSDEDVSIDDETTGTVDEESASETTTETTETVTTLAASATSASVDDADAEASSQDAGSTIDAASQDPDLGAEDDEVDETGEADVADEPDAAREPEPGPGTVDVEGALVRDRGAWNPSASSTLPAPSTGVSAEGGPGAAWSGSMPGASIGWLLPSLAIGAVGAFALVRARTRPSKTAGPVKGTRSAPESSPAADDEAQGEPSTVALPEPGLEGVLLLGQRALDQGDLEAAVGWFETAIAISPGEQSAHFCMGMCLDELGRLEEAADALDNAIELEPGDPLALYAQAGVLAQLGRNGDALEHASRLARASPGFREAMAEDEAFESLRDHPRFLALIGEL